MKALDLLSIHKIQYEFWVIKYVKDLPSFFYMLVILWEKAIYLNHIADAFSNLGGKNCEIIHFFSHMRYFSGEQFNFGKSFHVFIVD